MNNRGRLMAGLAALGTIYIADTLAREWDEYQAGDKRSGYTYMTDETRAMQDDDFENPAMLWVEQGEELWSTVDGKEGKACQTCHKDADKAMKIVGSTYPVYDPKMSKLISLEQRINQCRTERMGAKAWKWESNKLLSMTSFVRNQSRGEKISPDVTGPAKPFFEAGKKFYEARRGQLDMAGPGPFRMMILKTRPCSGWKRVKSFGQR